MTSCDVACITDVTLGGGSAPPSTSGAVPLLAVLEDLQERARELEDLEEGLEEEVDRRLEAVEEWTSKVDAALRLPGARGAGVAKAKSALHVAAAAAAQAERRPSPEAVAAFIAAGKALPAVVPRVRELEARGCLTTCTRPTFNRSTQSARLFEHSPLR